MLMIRLQRVGRKNIPVFRLVLTDSRNSTKSGKYVEVLGSYDPRSKGEKLTTEAERVKHWLGLGAQVSATVHNLFIDSKILTGKKKNVLSRRKPVVENSKEGDKKEPAPVSAAAEVAENPVTETKEEVKEAEPVKA